MEKICPKFEEAVKLLSKRWVGLIIHQLLDSSKRFSELEQEITVSSKVLSSRLKELEEQGIIYRDVYPERPVRIEYSLTKKGLGLAPVLDALHNWADAWITEK
ncbi:MAG: helix-turn-helix transcriptional regulator [Candidatus Izimaplasma sp.]|nr:helix-turn-helix transcriptional regulator [Candidatus Izimaplasma bacterium]